MPSNNPLQNLSSVFPIGMGTGFSEQDLKDPDQIVHAIQYGIDQGIEFIDTAENYPSAESLLGKALQGRRPRVLVASKFAPEHSRYEQVIAACEGSLRRLKTDYLDLYQLHWPNPSVPREETLRALEDLQKQGKIRAIGMCNVAVGELAAAISLQLEYNLYERTVELDGTLAECQRRGIPLIAYSPLDQGRVRSLSSQTVLAWLVSHRGVIVIPKSASLKHIQENIEAGRFKLDPQEFKRIDEEFKQEIVHIPTGDISISTTGERDRSVYTTLEEARENKFGYTPSPVELAKSLEYGGYVKPVRLIQRDDRHYELINGRIRYWAYLIAFGGTKPIPAYIRHDLRKVVG